MLRLALLGSDEQAIELAQTADANDDIQLGVLVHVGSAEPLSGTIESDWEGLLHNESIDAVIVGRENIPDREDALRKLAQVGKPLLLTFPPCDPIFAFELEMNRREGGGPILVYDRTAMHPLHERLIAECQQLGSIEFVSIARKMADCSRPSVRNQFTADVAILRRILGRLTSVSASGSAPESSEEANLSIAVENESRAVGRWAVEPGEDRATIKVRADGRTLQLEIGAQPSEWSLELPTGEEIAGNNVDLSVSSAEHALRNLADAITTESDDSSWDAICRDLEAADMIDISIRRTRTIELYGSEVSERGTFKGVMAAGGCFLLLLALFMLFVVSVVEGLQAPFREHYLWRLWPVYLLTPIVIFLLLQLLQLAIVKPKPSDS